MFVLALIGASTQCVADCFTQQSVPPCHQHSQSRNSAPEHCRHAQPSADSQTACQPAAETPQLAETTLQLFAAAAEAAPPDQVRSSFSILRL